jgi:hypothetical protein
VNRYPPHTHARIQKSKKIIINKKGIKMIKNKTNEIKKNKYKNLKPQSKQKRLQYQKQT